MAKERRIIKTWTNSEKDTHEVFQVDTIGLGYCDEDELRFQNKVKIRTHLPYRNEPIKFVPKSTMLDSEIEKEDVNPELIKERLKTVNVGLMTEKQLKHKLKEVKSVNNKERT